jgi:hypothetical protein
VALVALIALLLSQAPPGGVGAPVPTGVITGTVTTTGSGRPIRGARVSLFSSSMPWTAFTNAKGQFSFTKLPPGRFTIEVTHDDFLPASYGQKKPGKPGSPIDLAAGQRVDADVQMTRGSAITGTIVDEDGEPLVHGRVQALQYIVNQNGVRRLRVVNQVFTDDRGTYRFFNLAPDDYLISAKNVSTDPVAIEEAMSVVGDGVQIREMDNGVASITLEAVAFGGRVALVNFEGSTPDFAPTYHPAATTTARALPITVDGAAERSGVNIQVLPVRLTTITGTVVGMPAAPATGRVQVLLHNTDPAEEPTSQTITVEPDGQFVLKGVPPGHYTVYAQTLPAGEAVPSGNVQAVRTSSFERLHGSAPVIVTGPDTPPVVVTLRPGRAISGRLVLDLTQPPASRAATTISITPAPQPAGLPAFNTSPQIQVDADGNFTLPGIRPGRYFLRASGPGLVRSVMLNGVDTLDFPLEVSADEDVSGVVITLTDKQSELSGVVTDAAGKPNYECTVIVLSIDSRLWNPGSRRVMTTQPGADGRYSFRGLPAGDYRVAVVSEFDPASRFDSSYLLQLTGASVPVTITEGGTRTLVLRLAR